MKDFVSLRAMRGISALKLTCWMCLLLFTAATVSALEVSDARWGFDGQVVPNRFNLFSVLVANGSEEPFDGVIQLSKLRGMDSRVGAVYQTPCYVSPQTTRWVQFYVYVDNDYDEWKMEWGRGSDDNHDLGKPKLGAPAQVLLADMDSPESAVSNFKQFPEEL